MYFSLFDELCRNEFSHADIEKLQEDLKDKIYTETDSSKKTQV